jgi:ELWxxDGT repeat protein
MGTTPTRMRRATRQLAPAAPAALAALAAVAGMAAGWGGSARAQAPYLVQDLNRAPASRGAEWGASFTLDGKVFFAGSDASGTSLWATDGTALGTRSLADFCAVECNADFRFLDTINGVVLGFTPSTSTSQPRLWRSDGTPQGTYPLPAPDAAPLKPALNPDSLPGAYAIAGGFLYFNATGPDGSSGIWRTDGTAAGTQPVAALGGLLATASHQMVALAGKLYLVVQTIRGAWSLWATDGTGTGTVEVHDFGTSLVKLPVAAGNRLLLVATQPDGSGEVWASDGTAAGTRSVATFANAGALDHAVSWKPAGDHAFFVADDGLHGLQLWSSDGTAAGTRRLTGFAGGASFGSSHLGTPTLDPSQLEEVNGQAVFVAAAGEGAFQVWSASTSPGAAGPSQVALCAPGCVHGFDRLHQVGRRVLFVTFDARGIASTDGTGAGTSVVRLGCGQSCSIESDVSPWLGAGFFSVVHFDTEQVDLWRTDGTAAGTALFATPGPGQSRLQLGALGGDVVFASGSQSTIAALWISDGTQAGTRRLAGDVIDGGSAPDNFLVQGDRLVFITSEPFPDKTLWETDGTAGSSISLGAADSFTLLGATDSRTYLRNFDPASSTDEIWKSDAANPVPVKVAALPSFQNDLAVTSAAIFQGLLYLTLGSTSGGLHDWDEQLWKSDGTAAGTGAALQLPVGYISPGELTPLGPDLYFTSNGPDRGTEVLRSDGTASGTFALTHFGPAAQKTCPPRFTRVGANVFFVGWDAATGTELWVTGGTPGGTRLVRDQVSGSVGSFPAELTEHRGALYFFAFTSPFTTPQKRGLWRSDGTPEGTVLLAEFPVHVSGGTGCDGEPASLTSTGALLFFVVDDGVHGRELWKSDGTAAGTALVKDVLPGPAGSRPSALRAAAGQLFFSADDGVHGSELWRSDGSEAGTRMVADLAPGPDSSNPRHLAVVGSRLLFAADDGETGTELWALPLAGSGCQPSATVLCLQGNRFAVEVEWQDFAGNAGAGQAVALTADTGYFWFFAAANLEVIVKVLDGRPLNGNFWVFYGALSSVRYAVTVTDTATGLARRYDNFAGDLASVADTSAFGASGVNGGGGGGAAGAGVNGGDSGSGPARAGRLLAAPAAGREATAPAAAAGGCAPDSAHLCLNGSRFAVEASWTDFAGRSGGGVAGALTGDTGYFWFFAPENVEVVLKVLDGRALNGKFWVFYGALSNVEYTLKVTDTVTGAVRTYHNPSGRLASFADTSAF